MALAWKEVVARPEYQALPDEQKSLARQQYFDRVVAPQLQGEQVEQARTQFFEAFPLIGEAKPEVSAGRAALRGFNDALTFGFADEISSGLSAALNPALGTGNEAETFRDRYERNLDGERALDSAGREQYPAASIGAGLVGGMLPAVATGGASLVPGAARAAAPAVVRSLPQAIGEGAAVGGAYGAAYGLGSGDDDLEKRLNSAGEGAGFGMLVGGAIPAAMGGMQAARSAVASPERAAERQFERALERDGISPEEFRRRANDLQEKFPNTAIPVDAGGENVAGLLERLANTPGGGRAQVIPALNARQQGQPERLTDELYQLTGAGKVPTGPAPKTSDSKELTIWDGKAIGDAASDLAGDAGSEARRSAYRAIQDTMKSRSEAAKPLYEQAYKEPVPWTFELEELMKTPAMQAAYRDASKRAANQQRSFEGKFIDLADDGTYTVKDVPSTGDLDIMKRSLDDQIGVLLRSGENGKAGDIQGIKNQLLGIMDEHSPTYAKARAAWSDPSRYMDAIESGRSILNNKVSPEEFADIFRRMSSADQEGFRTGAISSIVGKMGDKTTSFADVTADLRSPNMRAKVAAILPDDASRTRWQDFLDHEIAGSQLRRQATGNSSTFRRQAEADDADDFIANAAGAARDAMSTTLTGFLNRAIPASYKWARDRVKVRSDAALADRLVNPKATAAPIPQQEPPKRLASQGGVAATVPGTIGGEQAAKAAPAMLPQLAAPDEEPPRFQTVDDAVDQLRPNGRPFQAEGEARTSKAYRDAARAGLSPEIVPVKGGFAVRAKDGAREVATAASAAATSPDKDLAAPTEAQKEAGNYKKGHVRIGGLDITIENPKGSERSGRRPDGTEWRHTMSDHYGYFKRSKGADNEQINAYIGPVPLAPQVYIVDQLNQDDGSFDEHKVMVGYLSERAAVAAYKANFDKGWKVGQVTKMPVKEFKAWLKEGTHGKPASEHRQTVLRQNGKPFEGKGDARVSLAYRNAAKAGRKPEIVQVEGGWALQV